MNKKARLALFLWLAVPLSACSSEDEPAGEEAPEGGLGLDAPDDVAAPPADAEVTPSGLASKLLEPGTGTRRPFPSDTVRVHYSGWQTDGTLFDSSLRRSGPLQVALTGVIAGWTEGLQLMVEGELRRFWIPQDLAYGDNPREGQPRGDLTFDVELLEIVTP
jgi:peptidylprolyl isomerase